MSNLPAPWGSRPRPSSILSKGPVPSTRLTTRPIAPPSSWWIMYTTVSRKFGSWRSGVATSNLPASEAWLGSRSGSRAASVRTPAYVTIASKAAMLSSRRGAIIGSPPRTPVKNATSSPFRAPPPTCGEARRQKARAAPARSRRRADLGVLAQDVTCEIERAAHQDARGLRFGGGDRAKGAGDVGRGRGGNPETRNLGGGLDRIPARRLVGDRHGVHRSGKRRQWTEEARLVLWVEHADHQMQRSPLGAIEARRQGLAGRRVVPAVQPQLAIGGQTLHQRPPHQALQTRRPYRAPQTPADRGVIDDELAKREGAGDRQTGVVDLVAARQDRERQLAPRRADLGDQQVA